MKYWCFRLSHPVDIAIACDYVNKKFPDRIGNVPAQCWSWLNKTSEQQIHYSDRHSSNMIVFDPVNKCWLLQSNSSYEVNRHMKSVAGHYANMSNVANGYCDIPFDDLYENHMDNARKECTIPDSTLSTLVRVANLELDMHNQEVRAYHNRQCELRAERDSSKMRNWNGDLLKIYR
ncbi:hypothetical protein [Aeromonas phage AS-yj]|uniref:Uncharacterized protein n=1 Tax=Aeromonas phage AS-yj TaxID=2026115 RepID=A0A291LEK9_9CAUD|nr:hypothetical protein [Aeromonas phage AS-yj]